MIGRETPSLGEKTIFKAPHQIKVYRPLSDKTGRPRSASRHQYSGPQLVQPQPRVPMVHRTQPGLYPDHSHRPDRHRVIRGQGTGDGHL